MLAAPLGHPIVAFSGRLLRIAKVRDEPYESLDKPLETLAEIRSLRPLPDLFTFAQPISDSKPKYDFCQSSDVYAVLPLTTYDKWFKSGIDFKTRNKLRKSPKAGVDIRKVELTDEFVNGVIDIYNESPIVQGRRNWHYGKNLTEMRAMLATFPGRSTFAGAFLGTELIGFIKLVQGKNVVHFMHIIAKSAQRDKAPTNALLGKAIELACESKAAYLHFGIWSRRGLGVFKMNHGFMPHPVPRYYVPLTAKGKLLVKLGLHRPIKERIPDKWIDMVADLRTKWYSYRQPKRSETQAEGKLEVI